MLWEMALLWFVEVNRTELRELEEKKKTNGNETTKIIIFRGKYGKKIKLTIKLYYLKFIPALVLLYGDAARTYFRMSDKICKDRRIC